MKHKEIKIGGIYDVRVKVIKKTTSDLTGQVEIAAYTVNRDTKSPMEYELSWYLAEEAPAFAEITSENGTKNTEPAPKYDPCRPYREGDKVRYVKRNGRFCPGSHAFEEQLSLLGTVVNDEQLDCFVVVNFGNEGDNYLLDPAYLELETPVEELGPYYVEPSTLQTYWEIWRRDSKDGDTLVVTYKNDYHPHAQAAAEAECERLNAEFRKETEQ